MTTNWRATDTMLSISPGGGPPSPLSSHSLTSQSPPLFRSSGRMHKSTFSKWRHSSTPYSTGARRSRFTPRTANINPFDPNNSAIDLQKPARKRISWNLEGSLSRESSSEGSEPYATDMEAINSDDIQPATSSEGETFIQMNTSITATDPAKSESRYIRDFEVVECIGTGDTGNVSLCRHRLDGCFYAVKQSSKPLRGSYMEKRALREVWAHAILGRHRRIVRYFSAWAEGQRMFIQNEYCAGGSLDKLISELKLHNQRLPESAIKRLILHVAQGLKYIHSLKASHMDIKPENIFLTKKIDVMDMNSSMFSNSALESSFDDGFCGDRDGTFDEEESDDYEILKDCVNFKIGDFGLVVKCVRDNDDPEPEEGDCRYLAPELLNDTLKHDYTKCDIFSLGLTIIETIRVRQLPKNGTEWHDLRSGQIPDYPGISVELMNLIRRMVSLNPAERPTAEFITSSPVIVPFTEKSRAQLRVELNTYKFKNDELNRELKVVKSVSDKKIPKSSRSIKRCSSLDLNYLDS